MEHDIDSHRSIRYRSDDGRFVIEEVDEDMKVANLGRDAVKRPNGVMLLLHADENEGGILDEVRVPRRLLNVIPIPNFEIRKAKAAQKLYGVIIDQIEKESKES